MRPTWAVLWWIILLRLRPKLRRCRGWGACAFGGCEPFGRVVFAFSPAVRGALAELLFNFDGSRVCANRHLLFLSDDYAQLFSALTAVLLLVRLASLRLTTSLSRLIEDNWKQYAARFEDFNELG